MDLGDDERTGTGLRVRREVLGEAYVDAALGSATPLDEAFQRYVTTSAWGDVWGRPGLDRPTRSLVTIALLAAGGQEHELELHLQAAARTGATDERIVETLLHVAVYAGVPAANRAFAVLRRVVADREGT